MVELGGGGTAHIVANLPNRVQAGLRTRETHHYGRLRPQHVTRRHRACKW